MRNGTPTGIVRHLSPEFESRAPLLEVTLNLYLAAAYTSSFQWGGAGYMRLTESERYHRDHAPHILESYHYIHKDQYVNKIRRDGTRVFLDSGAFSAYTQGIEVDIVAYCDYIKQNRDIIATDGNALLASVLDGIGDPLKTYQNQMTMEAHGVRPLPCFHYGEDERYLEHYVKNYEYITIGGMVPIANPQLYFWLDRIWERYLTDGSGRPRIKVHGFGLTSLGLMERYPWFSVDSSSWIQIGSNGAIQIPGHGILHVSKEHPSRKVANQHVDTIPAVQREAVAKLVESVGFTLDRLQADYAVRWAFNAWSYNYIARSLNNHTFKPDQITLF